MVQCEHLGDRNFSNLCYKDFLLALLLGQKGRQTKLIIPDVNSKDGDSNICTYI